MRIDTITILFYQFPSLLFLPFNASYSNIKLLEKNSFFRVDREELG